jgi:hypothetical protein
MLRRTGRMLAATERIRAVIRIRMNYFVVWRLADVAKW